MTHITDFFHILALIGMIADITKHIAYLMYKFMKKKKKFNFLKLKNKKCIFFIIIYLYNEVFLKKKFN